MKGPDFRHIELGDVASTNIECMERARAGDPGGLWITAVRQTGGRARRGRNWVSEPGNLYSSLLLIDPAPLEALASLPMAVTVAVHDAIASVLPADAAEALRIKWPNDMLIVTSGLLQLIDQSGPSAAARLRFALAHELAHRQLGHFDRRDRAGWDADAAEREADAVAIESLRTGGFPTDSGIELLQLIIDQRGQDSRGMDGLRARIAAMRERISRGGTP